MNRRVFIGGIVALGFAIFCGVMASGDYGDPVGVAFLLLWGFVAGCTLTASFLTTDNNKDTTKEDAEHKVD